MAGKPKRDKVGDDGMLVSVGDASVRIVTMPGHTPGTLAYLFEVRDDGKPLKIAYMGGTAIPFNGSAAYYDTYIASSLRILSPSYKAVRWPQDFAWLLSKGKYS